MTENTSEVIVIGGGIAGISAAARLSGDAKVTVIEGEKALGYHASGRSAALIEENYGAPSVQALNKATVGYLRDGGYLSPRGLMIIADRHEEEERALCGGYANSQPCGPRCPRHFASAQCFFDRRLLSRPLQLHDHSRHRIFLRRVAGPLCRPFLRPCPQHDQSDGSPTHRRHSLRSHLLQDFCLASLLPAR